MFKYHNGMVVMLWLVDLHGWFELLFKGPNLFVHDSEMLMLNNYFLF